MAGIKNHLQKNNIPMDFYSKANDDTMISRDLALRAKMTDPFQTITYCYFCGKEVVLEDSVIGNSLKLSMKEKEQQAHDSCLRKFLDKEGVKLG